MAGIISAIGKFFSLIILNPVANIKNPPHALKSIIISGVVSGKIIPAHKNKTKKIKNCGIEIIETTYPKLHANIAAVKSYHQSFQRLKNHKYLFHWHRIKQ